MPKNKKTVEKNDQIVLAKMKGKIVGDVLVFIGMMELESAPLEIKNLLEEITPLSLVKTTQGIALVLNGTMKEAIIDQVQKSLGLSKINGLIKPVWFLK